MTKRYLMPQVERDLNRKMVFLGGPRQCGKTTLAKQLLGKQKGYMNWDDDEDRDRILAREFPVSNLWVFDEIHKYRGWRNLMKGLFDKKTPEQKILVTGSARLDLYRFGGDSLQGRYHFLRLHPMTLLEIDSKTSQESLESLFSLSPFPEPLLSGSQVEARRWTNDYRKRLVREDIADLEKLNDLNKVEILLRSLPARVGSPLSLNSLREDLGVAHKTVANWVDILERVYSIYRIPPLGSSRIRAVKKEQKHYHFDWNVVSEEGPRFENLIANHLLKWTNFVEDTEGRELELKYFRDVDLREVDFVVTENSKPILMVEAKLTDAPLSPGLRYLREKFPKCSAWQVHLRGKKDYLSPEGIRVAPATELLRILV